MEKILYFMIFAFAVLGCGGGGAELDFERKGNCWQLSEKQFDRYAKKIACSSEYEAKMLLDKGYSCVGLYGRYPGSLCRCNGKGVLFC